MKKTLKFFSLAALTIAVAAMIGCSKDEELANNDKVVTSTATLTLDNGGEAAKALSDAGEKTFAAGEQIAVVYENTSHNLEKTVVTLTAGDITNSGKTANISVTMTNPESNGTLRIIYPAAMAGTDDVDYSNLANQDGTLTTLAANLDLGYYSGTLDGENLPASPALSNPLAVCEFTIKNSDGSSDLTSGITMLYIGDGTHSYYVTPSSASTIWVAMWPVASSQWLTFHATDGTNKYEKEITGKTLSEANMYHLGIKCTELQEGATFGNFSVDGSNTVHFSQGNLKYASGTWSFHTHQYDMVGGTSQTTSNMDLFYWGGSSKGYGATDSYTSGGESTTDVVNWGDNITSGTWNTPSTAAWQYIFNTRSTSTVNGTANARFARGQVCGVNGVILFPNRYTHPTDVAQPVDINDDNNHIAWGTHNVYSSANWAKMEAAGAVFLPAAGYRNGTIVYGVGVDGSYWSSTAHEGGMDYAYFVYFDKDYVGPDFGNNRDVGQSVRLVGE